MRIVIDLQGAQTESRFRGIGRYSMSFAKAVVRNRGEHEIILALSDLFPETIEPIRTAFDGLLPQENIRVWYVPGPVKESVPGNKWRREVAELTREAFLSSLNPDIIHITSFFEGYVDDAVTSIGRFDKIVPVSVSLYDLIPLINPDQYLKPNPSYEQYYMRKIKYLRRASLLLSISESSRNEGIKYLTDTATAITNISTAADAHFCPVSLSNKEKECLHEKFDINRPFVLYTGGTDIRKNLPLLIRAYGQMEPLLRQKYQLVFAGRMPADDLIQLKNEAKKVGLKNDEYCFTGYVSDEELIQLYNLCHLFVFPSWHEGFGLPALEAMACGAAVIGANTSSIPEVIGKRDALFDPFSEKAITNKITKVLINEDFRQSLIEYGLKQVKKFSWDKSAKIAIDAFEKISRIKESSLKKYNHSESLINELAKIRRIDQPTETDIIETAKCIDKNNKSILQYRQLLGLLTWRIEGPFDSTYSLALLNRETALALDKLGYNVALYSTEGPGDFEPDPTFLKENPIIKKIHLKSDVITGIDSDITSRNMYPPRVEDMKSSVRMLHHYAWEESGFPQEWVKNFNTYLDGLTCLSHHVQKIMIDNGVSVPMLVSGCGVDHWERIIASNKYKIKAKQFKFLHVSSCFPRKGVEYLLQAYGERFTSSDDVSLIIKTFLNPHNKIHQWVEDSRQNNPNYPHVVIIEKELEESELKALYELCDVLVAPSCAEGFGLPLAEAMLSGLPVITTAWSGQLDFCNDQNSWLIEFEFENAQTHFGLFTSVWAKPNVSALVEALSEAYNSTSELRASKAQAGRHLLLNNFKWTDVTKRYVNAVRNIIESEIFHCPKIAWVSTWNTKCGIATYSEHLINNMPTQDIIVFAPYDNIINLKEKSDCVRNWTVGKEPNGLSRITKEIEVRSLNVVIIQFNYGFYNHEELSRFIDENIDRGIKIVIVLHSTMDPEDKVPESNYKLQFILSSLRLCQRILVHSVADLNRLKNIGLINNVALFPHGVLNYAGSVYSVKKYDLPLIASYGFCLPHKGLEELVDAIAILRNNGAPVRLRLINAEHPSPESSTLVKSIKKQIKKLNLETLVEFNYQYLVDNESLELLSEANLIVFNYQRTGESSSAAVRYGLATKRPVAVTPLSIFDDISNAAFRFSGTDKNAIASGISKIIKSLYSNSEEARNIKESADKWRKEFDYATVGPRLYGICSALLQEMQIRNS